MPFLAKTTPSASAPVRAERDAGSTPGPCARVAVLCVGNRLMRDDGLGPAVHDFLAKACLPAGVDLMEAGCMTMDMVHIVRDYDWVVPVDAVDGTGREPGAIVRYAPDDAAPCPFGAASLHSLRLADVFEAALLLGYVAHGICFGMQVQDASPAVVQEGLSPAVAARVGQLADCVMDEVSRLAQTGTGRL